MVTVFSMIPGGVLSDMSGTQGLEAQQLAQGSTHLHRRLKRGWIWKQLFVPEEDPTPRVIGQVPHTLNVLHVLDTVLPFENVCFLVTSEKIV